MLKIILLAPLVKTVIIASIFLVIAIGLFSIRLFFVKNGEIRGGCAGKNPLLAKEGVACGMCGKVPVDGECGDDEKNKVS